MTCPVCGQAQPCVHVSPRSRGNSSALLDSQVTENGTGSPHLPSEGAIGSLGLAAGPVWRQEVASRVQQPRARRRRHADPNALELDFTADEPFSFTPPPARFAEIVVNPEQPKIIRFPRPAPEPLPAMQEISLDELQLAPETPRIVEAAEPELVEPALAIAAPEAQQMDLLPSFADIRLEPAASLQDDMEVIPRPAPLSQRVVACGVDAALVLIAVGTFAVTFLKLAEEIPHSRLTIVCALATCGIFWLLFQYMFLTYRRSTPGMQMAQLELCTFAGEPATRFARQCRALASALSGFSAGLGYAWAFIDEDQLGWHDRMTQTYVRFSAIPSGAREPYHRDNLEG